MSETQDPAAAADDTVAEQAAGGDQCFADDPEAGEAVMKRIRWNESLAKARALVARFTPDYFEKENRRHRGRLARQRAEQLISDVEWRQAKDAQARRRERAPDILYRTHDPARSAAYKAQQERHRETMARAAEHLVDHPGVAAFVEKHLPRQPTEPEHRDELNALINETSESAQMTERTKPASALEALAEELGIVAARFEHEANLKIKAMKSDLELHFQRCIADQQKEISELRGMIKMSLAARTEPGAIDFNEARAAVRN